jgi:hypothetical protein
VCVLVFFPELIYYRLHKNKVFLKVEITIMNFLIWKKDGRERKREEKNILRSFGTI